jgi:hypothetical protein
MFALARWEGPGVLLDATCPPRREAVIALATPFRIPATDLRVVQPRTRLAGRLKMSPPSMLVSRGGHVTSFWWTLWVFATTVMPAATDLAHRSES